MQSPGDQERDIDLGELGDRLSSLRLCDAAALEAMRRSLLRHGQLDLLSVFSEHGQLQIIDGFKRLRAARALGWRTVRARVADVDAAGATLLLVALHERRALTELEEGWLIRALHREHHLSQPVIAARLGRHRSWVWRRLMLVEALDAAVQADVRLGLLAPRAAVAVSQLPRGNQQEAARVVVRRGLTVRQTELLVSELLDLSDASARAQHLAQRLDGQGVGGKPGVASTRAARSELDWLAGDIRTLRLVAGRLEARLSDGSLHSLAPEAALLVEQSLSSLLPVLSALGRRIAVAGGAPGALADQEAA